MQPTAIYGTREGNLAGESVEMTVDANSMAHVMSLLTDLYSNPIAAVIREYSANALDSHVAAGQTRPIEISLPNGLSPFFKVKDYGVGLSVDDIREIYSKYGASTKRGSNEQVGMLGLGCKSALTYTQQFTIRAVKDNELAFIAISRTETGTGVMKIVQISTVDEENSVEISIPSTNTREFAKEAQDFFRFWKPGTVLVDGQEPVTMGGITLSDRITLLKEDSYDYIIMGNVAYRVSSDHALYRTSYYNRRFGIVARVPIGSVNFTPSREDLMYTELTKNTLDDIRREVQMGLENTIKTAIRAKSTHHEARKEHEEWRRLTGERLNGYSYSGEVIPTELDVASLYYRPDYGRNCVSVYRNMNFPNLEKDILIHGYENGEISTSHRGKMRLYAEQKGLGRLSFIVTKTKIEQKWFTNAHSVSWEEVFAVKKPRVVGSQGQESFHSIDSSSRYGRMLDTLPNDKTLILWTNSMDGAQDFMHRIVAFIPDSIAIRLPRNRWDKFLRENKNAVTMDTALSKMFADAESALSEEEKISMKIAHQERLAMTYLDPERLDDPELKRYAKVVRSVGNTTAIDNYRNVRAILVRLSHKHDSLADVTSFLQKYPLMAAVDTQPITKEHFYMYANTLYSNEVNNV